MGKGDKDTQAGDGDGNRVDQLSLKQVHNYADRMVERGHAEYNKGSILVKSKHPLDECLRRGIIEQEHHDSGKRIRNYRDCAVSKLSGRMYNASGEGDPEMDAATVYAIVTRTMRKKDWDLIKLVCFAEPNIDGNYYSEQDYQMLMRVSPNIQHAFECSDAAFADARKEVERRLAQERKRLGDTAEKLSRR